MQLQHAQRVQAPAHRRAPAARVEGPHGPLAELDQQLALFEPIALAQMDGVALQDRVDTKYVLHLGQLRAALPLLAPHYRVLEVDGLRLSPYQTLYFDTPDFALYLRHHAGWRNRYKVRSRRYVGSDRSFLEVKRKTNQDRTVKHRVETSGFVSSLSSEVADLVTAQIAADAGALEPKLRNDFVRITLVGRQRPERVTLDLDLRFAAGEQLVDLPGLVIAEVKQQGVDRSSAFVQRMHAAGLQPVSFSKYCVGVALLYPTIKHNTFKPQLRLVQKLMRGAPHGE